jgi:DNA-binding MarR family transcriptional regulator
MVTPAGGASAEEHLTGEGFKALAKDADLDGVDLRVLLYLLAFIDTENYTLVHQKDIAEELGRRPQHISRSIGKLEEKGILIPAPKVGRSTAWRLNPRYK